jgi:Flp/Fap pilin component
MSALITRFVRDQSGATAIEYGLIVTYQQRSRADFQRSSAR